MVLRSGGGAFLASTQTAIEHFANTDPSLESSRALWEERGPANPGGQGGLGTLDVGRLAPRAWPGNCASVLLSVKGTLRWPGVAQARHGPLSPRCAEDIHPESGQIMRCVAETARYLARLWPEGRGHRTAHRPTECASRHDGSAHAAMVPVKVYSCGQACSGPTPPL